MGIGEMLEKKCNRYASVNKLQDYGKMGTGEMLEKKCTQYATSSLEVEAR